LQGTVNPKKILFLGVFIAKNTKQRKKVIQIAAITSYTISNWLLHAAGAKWLRIKIKIDRREGFQEYLFWKS
jgi:hypothetical protein